jgi:2-polyprenyl-3-methyl-5-hydroxy-6-metoxy-1,4-benzoquinol methylase
VTTAPFDEAVARVARRYASASRSRATFHFVRGKLGSDPVTRALFDAGPFGDVVDVGSGRGQLGVLLLEAKLATTVTGFDWAEDKVNLANRAAEGLAATFVASDVRSLPSVVVDTVLAIDVLHYFDRAVQDVLFERWLTMVRPGGRLFLREADTSFGLRTWMTKAQETVGLSFGVNRGLELTFRDVAKELVPLAMARGFACNMQPCWGRTPLSNVLLTATRPG